MSKGSKETQDEYNDLLRQYISICNDAMNTDNGDFPLRKTWAAILQHLEGERVEFAVRDDRPKAVMSVDLGKSAMKPANEESKGQHSDWTFDYSFLRKVVDNPKDYINDPTKLDWDWLLMKKG